MKRVMEAKDISRSLARMAHEIVEDLGDSDRLFLVGIHSGGVPLAHRLANHVEQIEGNRPPVGEMDITLYRDDLYTGLEHPVLGDTRLPDSLTGAHVVLVDDVLFTGRTVRAALDEIMDFGRPACIKLAVLVDRGHRELPVAGNYVGRTLETDKEGRVRVEAGLEFSDEDCVVVEPRGDT
jgi:pyrimidine operon attenuation protein/uracil phosphoribosyltransferase